MFQPFGKKTTLTCREAVAECAAFGAAAWLVTMLTPAALDRTLGSISTGLWEGVLLCLVAVELLFLALWLLAASMETDTRLPLWIMNLRAGPGRRCERVLFPLILAPLALGACGWAVSHYHRPAAAASSTDLRVDVICAVSAESLYAHGRGDVEEFAGPQIFEANGIAVAMRRVCSAVDEVILPDGRIRGSLGFLEWLSRYGHSLVDWTAAPPPPDVPERLNVTSDLYVAHGSGLRLLSEGRAGLSARLEGELTRTADDLRRDRFWKRRPLGLSGEALEVLRRADERRLVILVATGDAWSEAERDEMRSAARAAGANLCVVLLPSLPRGAAAAFHGSQAKADCFRIGTEGPRLVWLDRPTAAGGPHETVCAVYSPIGPSLSGDEPDDWREAYPPDELRQTCFALERFGDFAGLDGAVQEFVRTIPNQHPQESPPGQSIPVAACLALACLCARFCLHVNQRELSAPVGRHFRFGLFCVGSAGIALLVPLAAHQLWLRSALVARPALATWAALLVFWSIAVPSRIFRTRPGNGLSPLFERRQLLLDLALLAALCAPAALGLWLDVTNVAVHAGVLAAAALCAFARLRCAPEPDPGNDAAGRGIRIVSTSLVAAGVAAGAAVLVVHGSRLSIADARQGRELAVVVVGLLFGIAGAILPFLMERIRQREAEPGF